VSTFTDHGGLPEVPDGQVKITPKGPSLLVEIGRAKYTKRFQLSPAEAALLLAELPKFVAQ
jgi:hypothetical protein